MLKSYLLAFCVWVTAVHGLRPTDTNPVETVLTPAASSSFSSGTNRGTDGTNLERFVQANAACPPPCERPRGNDATEPPKDPAMYGDLGDQEKYARFCSLSGVPAYLRKPLNPAGIISINWAWLVSPHDFCEAKYNQSEPINEARTKMIRAQDDQYGVAQFEDLVSKSLRAEAQATFKPPTANGKPFAVGFNRGLKVTVNPKGLPWGDRIKIYWALNYIELNTCFLFNPVDYSKHSKDKNMIIVEHHASTCGVDDVGETKKPEIQRHVYVASACTIGSIIKSLLHALGLGAQRSAESILGESQRKAMTTADIQALRDLYGIRECTQKELIFKQSPAPPSGPVVKRKVGGKCYKVDGDNTQYVLHATVTCQRTSMLSTCALNREYDDCKGATTGCSLPYGCYCQNGHLVNTCECVRRLDPDEECENPSTEPKRVIK